jgi:hypothetical protein
MMDTTHVEAALRQMLRIQAEPLTENAPLPRPAISILKPTATPNSALERSRHDALKSTESDAHSSAANKTLPCVFPSPPKDTVDALKPEHYAALQCELMALLGNIEPTAEETAKKQNLIQRLANVLVRRFESIFFFFFSVAASDPDMCISDQDAFAVWIVGQWAGTAEYGH